MAIIIGFNFSIWLQFGFHQHYLSKLQKMKSCVMRHALLAIGCECALGFLSVKNPFTCLFVTLVKEACAYDNWVYLLVKEACACDNWGSASQCFQSVEHLQAVINNWEGGSLPTNTLFIGCSINGYVMKTSP